MPRVLLIDPIPSPMVERLRPLFPASAGFDVVPTSSEEDLAKYGAEAEILLVIRRKVDARLLSFVPRVRLVQVVSVGYDNLDLGALQAAGVVAAYTPGANATVGLVGFGNIGRAVAERLLPFGSRLLYTARHAEDPAIEQQFGMRYASLDDLLASSTIVSLHLPLTEATRGLIGEAELAKMPAGAFLINTSRGEVLDYAPGGLVPQTFPAASRLRTCPTWLVARTSLAQEASRRQGSRGTS